MAIASERFAIPETTGSFVLATLRSVEHVADSPVGDSFDLEVTVVDGINDNGKFDPSDVIKIAAGSTVTLNEILFTGEYDGETPSGITFIFKAEAKTAGDVRFDKIFGDEPPLKPGRYVFRAPVVLASRGKKSEVVFHGRIDVS